MNLYLTGSGVYLHKRWGYSVGVGEREVAALIRLGHVELRPIDIVSIQASLQILRQPRQVAPGDVGDLPQRHRAVGAANPSLTVGQLDVILCYLHQVRRDLDDLVADLAA